MSRRRALPAIVAAGLALTLGLAACSAGGDEGGGGGDSTTGTTGEPQAGGTLTFAASQSPGCLDPQQLAQAITMTVGRQITDSLTVQDPETGEIKPWLASEWEASADGTAFTFTLIEGATFSDGAPVNAEAVKANFDGIVELGARSLLGSTYLDGLVSTEVVDPQTVTFTFDEPNAQFLQATASITLGLLSPATLALTPEERCAGDLIGSGPFVLSDYVQDESITLTKREGYDWPNALAEHTGDAYLDTVVLQLITEPAVRTGSLQSGQVQGIQDVQPVDQDLFDGGEFSLLTQANPGIVTGFVPNTQRPAMADPAVRDALQVAINRQETVDTLYNDRYLPATSVLAGTTPGYLDLTAELAYDPETAIELLDGAGWVAGADGIRVKDGEPLTLSLLGGGPESALVQQQLAAVGIDLQIRQVDAAQYVEIQSSGDYDLAGYNLTRADPDVLKAIFSTEYTNVPRLEANPLDDTLAEMSVTLDTDARNELAGQAQQTIIGEGYNIPLVEQFQVFAFSSDVQGITLEASTRLSFYDTWLEN
ncbi:ABC transporter substrate-binding protein [Occultella gossypii]|uniref:ABC transporter substrate-binding protein n=1 Tax=Occultella gossypii TaxID=2800820 RepID=A0ABS7S4Z7_9MICO|nr:ABC transporter substrate-binding protein [Occultella gossypii]MBZ2195408.1 ABC transporter substrate-binding protein [Occultella gossypii]